MDADEVREQWSGRETAYSPEYYAYYGPDDRSELIRAHLDGIVEPDDAVLEVGCSSGRHLWNLHEHGYTDLHGIEINDEAIEVMASAYPGLAAAGTFYLDAVENVVREFAEDRFGAVYAVETLQHIHPDDDWVFAELARITEEVLVTAENEDDGDPGTVTNVDGVPLYFRQWDRVFEDLGFVEVDSRKLERATMRVFRPDSG